MRGAGRWALALCALCASVPLCLRAQDTLPPADQGVRIGITYTPGVRPGMLVLGGPPDAFQDSVRAILRRDLDFSDRFESISLPGGDTLLLGIAGIADTATPGASGATFVNYGLYAALGAEFAVALTPAPDSGMFHVTLYDVPGQVERRRFEIAWSSVTDPAFRMRVHHMADELVRAATGEPGMAATRLAFVSDGRLYRVDADAAVLEALTPRSSRMFSPAWSPDGARIAYTELSEGWGRIVVRDLKAGTERVVEATREQLNYTATFSPDGQTLAFSRSGDEGTDIYTYNLAQNCCLQRLTVGRFSDNLSPTFSPDGRQIAFVSTRPGLTQIYVMARDGTGQELFAPFDYGVTGTSNAPDWSPDGRMLAFHRDVAGSPQVFIMDARKRVVRQLTSAGRNEDPTWAPDSRHIAFVSSRTGSRQLWVIDIETGRVRQLTTIGQTRLPAWSLRLPVAAEGDTQPNQP
jgi:TolB protein